MSCIFLSHSSADELEAIALKQWLMDNGWGDVFLDIDPERGLAAGERWQEALRRAADRCEAVVFVVSPAWAKSKWCLAEFLLAKSLSKLIFGVVLKEIPIGELPTEMTAEWQLCHLIGQGSTETIHFTHREKPAEMAFLAEGLKRLRSGLKGAGLSASFFPWPPKGDESRSPYRGLEPLDAQDAAVFFGRDAEIMQGLDRLRGMRAAGNEGLFVILGASGAGKSSFLRAGLLPRLFRDDRHFFSLGVIRPERSPLYGDRGLANAISLVNRKLKLAPVNLGDVKMVLMDGPERFAALLDNIQTEARARLLGLPDNASPPTLVLSVDQAEELFNADAMEEARAFLNLIGSVLRGDSNGFEVQRMPMIVALTIRSDRYEPLQTAFELAGLKTVVFDALRPMPPAQFKEVITGPASRTQVGGRCLEVKPDLVNQLLEDCAKGADTLPLLGLTLARLYRDYGSDGDLRLDEYHGMGGMADVIKAEAESILAIDSDSREAQLKRLRAAFIPWLATINRDNDQPMRRVARMSDLPEDSRPLVRALIDEKRLLLSDLRNSDQVVEVAHESLLRQWKVLADWLYEEREALKEVDRLEQDAKVWMENGKRDAWLREGERLGIGEALAANPAYHTRLEPVSRFLLASRQREEQRREEEERVRQVEILAAQEKQKAAEALAAEQMRATQRAQADAARLENGRIQLTGLLLLGAAQAILSGIRPGGSVLGLWKMLAAHRIAPHIEIESAILAQVVAFERMEKIIETGSPVGAVAFSPDNRRVVSGGGDKTLRLWDVQTGQPIGEPMRGHEGSVRSAAFSPDGHYLVSGGDDQTLRLWNVQTGQPLGEPMRGHEGSVRSAAFSPDGHYLVSGGDDQTLRLWNVQTGQPLGEPMRGHEGSVRSAAFSPYGHYLVSGGSDQTLRLWIVETGQPFGKPMRGHEGSVRSVAFSSDRRRRRVVSGGDDQTLRLWDVETGQPIGEPMRGHKGWVWSVAFSPDGRRVVSGGSDQTLRLWNVETGLPIGKAMRGHNSFVESVAFSPDGRRVVSGASDQTLRLWDIQAGELIGKPMRGHQSSVTSVAFSPDSRRVISGASDQTLRLWDLQAGRPIGKPMRGHESSVTSVAFSPDGRCVVSGGDDQTLRLWNVQTGQPIGEPMRGHEDYVTSVAFSPDGRCVVSGGDDQTLRLWDVETGQPIGEPMRGHKGWVWSVAFSPDGRRVVSGGSDQTLRLWDLQAGRPIGKPMRGHESSVTSVAFSPDGRCVVSGGDDQTLRLWNVQTGQPIGEPMRGHESSVTSVAFSPDGRCVVSGGDDQTLRLWDLQAGRPIGKPMRGHEDYVTSVAFSPDGRCVVSGGDDQTLRLWPAPKVWPDLLCAKLTRNMSRREWREQVSADIEYRELCPGLPTDNSQEAT